MVRIYSVFYRGPEEIPTFGTSLKSLKIQVSTKCRPDDLGSYYHTTFSRILFSKYFLISVLIIIIIIFSKCHWNRTPVRVAVSSTIDLKERGFNVFEDWLINYIFINICDEEIKKKNRLWRSLASALSTVKRNGRYYYRLLRDRCTLLRYVTDDFATKLDRSIDFARSISAIYISPTDGATSKQKRNVVQLFYLREYEYRTYLSEHLPNARSLLAIFFNFFITYMVIIIPTYHVKSFRNSKKFSTYLLFCL